MGCMMGEGRGEGCKDNSFYVLNSLFCSAKFLLCTEIFKRVVVFLL